MDHTASKQTKLLGAQVRDLGLVVAVSARLADGYAVIEGGDKVNRLVRFADLERSDVTFALESQPYSLQTERVCYGTFDEVYSLTPVAKSVGTPSVDLSERAELSLQTAAAAVGGYVVEPSAAETIVRIQVTLDGIDELIGQLDTILAIPTAESLPAIIHDRPTGTSGAA